MRYTVSQILFIISLVQEHRANDPGSCPLIPFSSTSFSDGTCYDGDFVVKTFKLVPDFLPCDVWCFGLGQQYKQSLDVSSLMVASPVSMCSVGLQSISTRGAGLDATDLPKYFKMLAQAAAKLANKHKPPSSSTPSSSALGKRASKNSKNGNKLNNSPKPPYSVATAYRLLWVFAQELIRHYMDMDYIRQFTLNIFQDEERFAELGSRLNSYLQYLQSDPGTEQTPTGNGDASKSKNKEKESRSRETSGWKLCKCDVAVRFNRMLLATNTPGGPSTNLLFQTLCEPSYIGKYLASLPTQWQLSRKESQIIDNVEHSPPIAKDLITFSAIESQQGFPCSTEKVSWSHKACMAMYRPEDEWLGVACWKSLKLHLKFREKHISNPNCGGQMSPAEAGPYL